MKVILTKEETKNIIADFVHKRVGGEKPTEVIFVMEYLPSGKLDEHTEVIFPDGTKG